MTFEELMKLKVGDRVVAKGKTWFDTKAGDKGSVVGFDRENAVIKWDDNVNGWRNDDYDIKDGHGEYIGKDTCNMIELLNPLHNHKLIITCEDGKHTNAKYYINNKLVSESSTSCYEKYDDFDFKTAVNNCIDRLEFNQKPTKGQELVGQKIKKGQRVKIINVEPHKNHGFVCLDEYINKIGYFNYDFIFDNKEYGGSVTFDKEYMNVIEKENGCLCWRWDEVELLDDGD